MKTIERVLTTQEVAKKLGYKNDSTIRKNIMLNKYDKEKYRKTGNIHLFDLKYVEQLKKEREKNK